MARIDYTCRQFDGILIHAMLTLGNKARIPEVHQTVKDLYPEVVEHCETRNFDWRYRIRWTKERLKKQELMVHRTKGVYELNENVFPVGA